MKTRYFIAMSVIMPFSISAFAAGDGERLFNKNNCNSCHAPVQKTLGPSLADIAAKYKDDKNVRGRLATKVRNGGKDSFGHIPMPATAKPVSDGDINTMVTWILNR